jgi:hypothetical protein
VRFEFLTDFEYAGYGLCKDVMACSLDDGVPASGITADFVFTAF